MANKEDFRKYLPDNCRKSWEDGILIYLATLAQASTEESIKHVANERAGQLMQAVSDGAISKNTAAAMVTGHNNAVRKYQQDIKLDESNSFENPGGKPKDVVNGRTHFALKYLQLGRKFHEDRQKPTVEKRENKRRNRQTFNPFEAIRVAEAKLKNGSYLEIAAAFEFLTGRRMTEVLKGAGFGKVKYRHILEFSGQLKSDGKTYEIYTLTEAKNIIDALARMKKDPSVKELEDSPNAKISKKRQSSYNYQVRKIFGSIIPAPHGDTKISSHDLRAAYINAAAVLFKDPRQDFFQFAEEQLGHENAKSTTHYMIYVCLDDDGNPIEEGQWREKLLEEPGKPKSKRRTSMSLDGLRLERLKAISEGNTNAEKLDAALTAYEENQKLKNKVTDLEKQVKFMADRIAELTQDEAPAAAESAPVTTAPAAASSTDWASVPSEELKGSHAPGSAEEKIKRAIDALLEYNEGKAPAEQYRLSEANVRYLSGSRHGTVKEYFLTHPELQKHPEASYGTQHDRGKTPIADVISW